MEVVDLATLTPRIQSVLALGMEGAGKTHFIGTFPKPILLHSFDKGYETLAGVPGVKVKSFLEKDRSNPTAAKEFEAEFRKLLSDPNEMIYTWPDGKKEAFKTVAIDPLSFLSQFMMHQIQKVNGTTDKKPSWDEYDIILKKTTDVLLRGLQLQQEKDVFLVATCHLKTDKDEDTGQIWFLADILGSAREKLGAWFDAVLYLKASVDSQTGNRKYTLSTIGERRERARLRLPSAIEGALKAVEEPDFGLLLKKVQDAFLKGGSK